MKRFFSAPTSINLEMTELCNVKCRHCYNFWRDESMGQVSLGKDRLDLLIDKLIEGRVFHVVMTGGEPFARFELLEHALARFQKADISVSCNSNLMLADDDRCTRLAALGLDHILTSLPSCDPATNDYIMQSPGAFEKIIDGIKACRRHGIRVSVNNVITEKNYHQVYETAKLVHELGAQKIFVTRSVPPTYSMNLEKDGYLVSPESTMEALNQAVRAKEDFGIQIGSLVSYPLCFLSDLEKFRDFVGRGCPAQAGHRFSINANGDSHACVHEEEAYGNLFEASLSDIYGKMRKWHDGSFRYPGCAGCRYADICESGCSMSALAVHGAHEERDPLFQGPHHFARHYRIAPTDGIRDALLAGAPLHAPARLRYRQEDGFTLLNIRWANTIPVEDDVAAFLKARQETGAPFTADDFGRDRIDLLVSLVVKDAVEAPGVDIGDAAGNVGLSVNPEALEQVA